MKLVWLDLETTGLSPRSSAVLAFGVRVTDARLTVLGELEAVLHYSESEQKGQGGCLLESACREMHSANGLLLRAAQSDLSCEGASLVLATFLRYHLGGELGILAGSSVHFDRSFLDVHMPQVVGLFSHRHLDVSVFKVLAQMWGLRPPSLPAPRHMPLADLDVSISLLRHWQGAFLPPQQPKEATL